MRTLQRSLLTIAALSMFSSPTVLAQTRPEEGRSPTGTESTSGAGSSSRSSGAQGSSAAQGTGGTGTGTSSDQPGGTAQQNQPSQTGTAAQQNEPQQTGGMAQREQERASGMMASDTKKSLSLEQRKQIQTRLQTDGYYDGEIDGVIGQSTKDAVRKFQQANQLPATGQITQQTMAALGVRGAPQGQGAQEEQGTRATSESSPKTARLSDKDTVTLTDLQQSQTEALQRKLKDYGFYDGDIDGVIGPQTRRALQAFYREQAQLVASGKLLSDSASSLTGDSSIQRVRGEDDEDEDKEKDKDDKAQEKKREKERKEQGASQGQTRGTSGQTPGSSSQMKQGTESPRQQQSGPQGQSGWRRSPGTTTPEQPMPEGQSDESDETMHKPGNMPDNPR